MEEKVPGLHRVKGSSLVAALLQYISPSWAALESCLVYIQGPTRLFCFFDNVSWKDADGSNNGLTLRPIWLLNSKTVRVEKRRCLSIRCVGFS